jgi:Protein of unknown function (DUF541)
MNLPRSTPIRVILAIAAAVAIVAAVGSATAATGASTLSPAGPFSWCCPDTSSRGITATGQATVHGRGTTARDQAIAKAVTDATDQAQAAAQAAGVTLGAIQDIQISSPSYAYPVAEGAPGFSTGAVPATVVPSGSASTSSAPGGNTSSGTAVSACPLARPCTGLMPAQIATFATVTITWSIG